MFSSEMFEAFFIFFWQLFAHHSFSSIMRKRLDPKTRRKKEGGLSNEET
jgi:hypothetical protein